MIFHFEIFNMFVNLENGYCTLINHLLKQLTAVNIRYKTRYYCLQIFHNFVKNIYSWKLRRKWVIPFNFANENELKFWKLTLILAFLMVFSQKHFPNGDFPNDKFTRANFSKVKFPKRQLPKGKVRLRLEQDWGPSAAVEQIWEVAASEIPKYPWEFTAMGNAFGKVLNIFLMILKHLNYLIRVSEIDWSRSSPQIKLEGTTETLEVYGVPRNMTASCKTYWMSSFIFENICGIFSLIITKYPWSWHLQNVVCIFCAFFNITGDMKNLNSDFDNFISFNKIEIRTKFLISQVILTAQKKADHILQIRGLG